MSVTLYIPLAKEFRLLPLQVSLCRKHVADLSRIVVVETPAGQSWLNSGGPWRLRRDVAADLGVEIMAAANEVLGVLPMQRIATIFRWLRDVVVPNQSEDRALILSGDVLPVKAINLSGNACRFPWQNHTWFFATRGDQSDWVTYRGVRIDYGMERLEPGFLHADKLVTSGEFDLRKTAWIESQFTTRIPGHPDVREKLLNPERHDFKLPWTEKLEDYTGLVVLSKAKTRRDLCTACPVFRHGEVKAETWCALADDQPQTDKNCDGAKHRRWLQRLASGDCPKNLWPKPPPCEPCPSCDLPVPPIRTLADVHTAVREILARDLEPPAFREEIGIVTAGEGRYEAGIVIGIKLLRDVLKCDLPVTVFHRGQWQTCLRGYDVNFVSSDALQAAHPARNYGGWQSKSYAVVHAGYKRCLWLDADAYCIRDPRPLFFLLDDHGYVGWKDYGPGAGCGPEMKLPCHFNGGVYLVNLETHWNQMVATRFLDNHGWCSYAAVNPAFIRHGLGDECSTRLVRHLSNDRGYYGAEWCGKGRTKGVGFLAYWRDVPYLAHRMRKESKLFLGTVPRSNLKWPHESTVLRLFEELSPEYQAQKAAAIYARSPQGLREARRKILQNKGKRCPRASQTVSPALAR